MHRSSPGNIDSSTTAQATVPKPSSILASYTGNHSFSSPTSSARAPDEIIKHRSSPFHFLDSYSPSRLVAEPQTPFYLKNNPRSSSRSPSVLPTPPDSLTRLQQQQAAAFEAQNMASTPPSLAFSHKSDPVLTPSRHASLRKLDLSRIKVVDSESDLMSNDPHIQDGSSSITGRIRSMSHSLGAESAPQSLRDGISFSETASLLSAVSLESNTDSGGSATSRSPSLSMSMRHRHELFDERQEMVDISPSLLSSDSAKSLTEGSHLSNPLMTTNVYINGLPPHYPEQELHDIVRKYGSVISVKTFTRNSDPPSGYGFVLYENIHGAENCVKSLRQYRNLHPSFAKRTHRIPGTALEAPIFTPALPTYPSPVAVGGLFDSHESFNAKMERLADQASSNLYIEGLPASADAHLLDALVAPHRIRSSRIFPSKLSNPPKMIAFVRLETRDAALEAIDRLNGRVVRGWDDDDEGDKIIVKFADSAYQRDLRKMERLAREQRDALRMQSACATPALPSSPYAVGLPAPAQISNLQTVVQNAGLGVTAAFPSSIAGNSSASLPATAADIERLIEAVRIQSLSAQAHQLPSANSSLAAILAAQQQLQTQNQMHALYNAHAHATSSTFPGGSLYSMGASAPQMQSSGLPVEQVMSPSYASAASHDTRPSNVNADLARLRSASSAQAYVQPAERRTLSRKTPTMPVYVPPQARGEAIQTHQAHHSDSLRRT